MPKVKNQVVPTELRLLSVLELDKEVPVSDLQSLVKFVSKGISYLKFHWGYDIVPIRTGKKMSAYKITKLPVNDAFLRECGQASVDGKATKVHSISYNSHGIKAGSPSAPRYTVSTKPQTAPKATKPKSKIAKARALNVKPLGRKNVTVVTESAFSNPDVSAVDSDFDSMFDQADIRKMII